MSTEDLEDRVEALESKLEDIEWKEYFWNLTAIFFIGSGLILLIKDLWHWIFG